MSIVRRLGRLAALVLLASGAGVGLPAHAGGTLTVCTDGSPEGFDTVQYESIVTGDATVGIYEQLLHFKPGGSEVEPGLAERWEVSADGLAYTLHLRRGVSFHGTAWFKPSREFDADDVLWSINRVNDKKHPAHGVARNGYVYWAGMQMPSLIASLEKLDRHTVRFRLTRPEAPFLANLAMAAIGTVYSAEYGEQLLKAGKLEQLNTLPIGTGPFAFRSYQKGAAIRYVAHPKHWAGPPQVEQLVYAITPDPNVRAQRVKAGECLVGIGMKRESIGGFASRPEIRIERSQPLQTSMISPNTERPFLSDRRFRQALRLAFDARTFVESVYGGLARPAGSFLPPGMWSFDATLQPRFDPEAARKLVQASGYDGRELTIFINSGGSYDGRRAGELLQADWARIGVKLRLRLMEGGELLQRAGRGEHDLVMFAFYSDNGDPDNFFTPNLSCAAFEGGGNKSRWCNPVFDRLLDEARRSNDPRHRSALYVKAQRIVFDEVALIPTVHAQLVTALNRRVQGFGPNPFGTVDLRGLRLN
ncbi:ABC transporter substrate-binding protein [Rivibacter subsaxonicus]|uniref:Dipeptide transport system substrate-binding protein n=1 Tax=Rivibacter subsaxonicus TaxID=457575 RepID=A0A4Q7VDC2_9BURK|nr:ABC transporter substrate-binding protein [Rivibacter subsaxonicus]RZT93884.1 dipeptide transport system substrate-binding protein [Rivibacter subsaxonicus]